jgi:hypothetical protein
MMVPNFEGKPNQHDWCRHACNKGCAIYDRRPDECRDFNCLWLIDERIPDYWHPVHSKIVINPKLDGNDAYVAFIVDPAYPNRWREKPWIDDIKTLARAGIEGRSGQKWCSFILIKDERIAIGL